MAPAKANSIATAKPNAQTAGMNRLEEGPRCMENYGSELAAVVKVAGARLSKFLNIETQAPEERSVEPGERGVGIADSAQSKYSGVLRILTRPLDIKEADSPTTVCTDVEEPVIDLRKDSSIFVIVGMGYKSKIVWQDNTHLARIEMRGLLLHQLAV